MILDAPIPHRQVREDLQLAEVELFRGEERYTHRRDQDFERALVGTMSKMKDIGSIECEAMTDILCCSTLEFVCPCCVASPQTEPWLSRPMFPYPECDIPFCLCLVCECFGNHIDREV